MLLTWLQRPASRGVTAGAATLLWVLLCLLWFDPGRVLLPAWLAALPPGLPFLALLLPSGLWLLSNRSPAGEAPPATAREPWLLGGLALLVRLPLVVWGSAGYLTSDGALSGIVMLRVRAGLEHYVFLPALPYSGSLKSHLAAPLALLWDPARAFALLSTLFYGAFVAGVWWLARRVGGRAAARGAALYLIAAPTFVTQYSLSNDGNYVEVLAFGTWALVAALGWHRQPQRGGLLALSGLLLGLGFWCHILALAYIITVGLVVLSRGRAALGAAARLAAAFGVGYAPGIVWNVVHGWASFVYLLPGLRPVGERARQTLLERAAGVVFDHTPTLFGYVPVASPVGDVLLKGCAWLAAALALASCTTAALVWSRQRSIVPGALLALALATVGLALFALPYVPGSPRYLLFLMTPVPVFLGLTLSRGRRRLLLATLLLFGAAGSALQARDKLAADRQWRGFVRNLEQAGVRRCYTDFFLATKINFLSEERIVCSAKLGPTTTEYFFEYRRAVESAPRAALVAASWPYADKLERKLNRLGVTWERHNFMRPVLVKLSRKVDPEEIFPGRRFPLR